MWAQSNEYHVGATAQYSQARRFDEADRVQGQLRALGVETDDRSREWRVKY